MVVWVLITWSFTVQELAAGVLVSIATALFSSRFFVHGDSYRFFNPAKIFSLLGYSVTFFVELVKANLDMAKRVYGGCKAVNPGIVKVPTEMKSDYGLALLSDSITLTPGTITMDVAEEDGKNFLYVHWIDVTAESGEQAGEAIKGALEKGTRRVFD
jgi:multicomponent Na+:H+ antiporter subunit E